MPEQVTLDPVELVDDRVELDITEIIPHDGVDWGDASIEAYMAEAARGSLPVDYRIPNRQIQIPLYIRDHGVTVFDEWRTNLQAKVALFQREGGAIKRQTNVGSIYADVVSASLKLGGSGYQANMDFDMDAVLSLECTPDWYGEETGLNGTLGTDNLTLASTGIKGDYPGRVSMLMDNGSAQDQRGMIWGIRSRNYSSAATAQLAYDASDMTELDATTTFGAAVIHASLSESWTPVFRTSYQAAELTHVGTYQVWIRASTSATTTSVSVRLLWDVGDLALPVENQPVTIPGGGSKAYALKLGEVRLDKVPLGEHRWGGVVQARGEQGVEQIAINRIWIVPADDGYGELRASVSADVGLGGYSARDEFNQTSGSLTGKTASSGGVWAGAGDADDFEVFSASRGVRRTALSDALNTGRYAISGVAAFATQVATVDVTPNYDLQVGPNQKLGVMARYVDVNNWLIAAMTSPAVGFGTGNTLPVELNVWKRVAGTITRLNQVLLSPWEAYAGFTVTLRLFVDTAGSYVVWAYQAGATGAVPILSGQDSSLATGGALATGKPGFYDEYPFAAGTDDIRRYDSFAAWAPDPDAVMFASQSTSLTTVGMFREDLFGITWSPVSNVIGDLPRLPPSGLEGRAVEFFVKISRGDLTDLPDTGSDAFGIVPSYRPSWLVVPG